MKFKKSQSGRSMVEMLGVLAIIGVLSVGGIAGYSLSMRRHRANGVIDNLSKYALVAYSSCQQKILNGEINELSECVNSRVHLAPYFEETGIGNLPAGILTTISSTKTDSSSGVDIVIVSAVIDDDKLCQAVASIAGTKCEGGTVLLPIKQN